MHCICLENLIIINRVTIFYTRSCISFLFSAKSRTSSTYFYYVKQHSLFSPNIPKYYLHVGCWSITTFEFIFKFINPFMQNVCSHPYQLDESISNFRVVGWYFSFFYSNYKRNCCQQTVENLIRRRVLRRLVCFCTVCRCPIKRTLGVYVFKELYVQLSEIMS